MSRCIVIGAGVRVWATQAVKIRNFKNILAIVGNFQIYERYLLLLNLVSFAQEVTLELLSPVYTIQPVVKSVVRPVVKRFDSRLHQWRRVD